MRDFGNLFIVIERGFDIEANPVDERKYFTQALRIDPRCVQPDRKTHRLDGTHGSSQPGLQRRFAATEHNGIEQAAAALKKCDNGFPVYGPVSS